MIRFDHLSLPVSDPARSRDWYVANFGFEVEFDHGDTIAIRDDADFTLFLYRPPGALAGAKVTLTFQVDDVEDTYRRLRSKGIEFVEAPSKRFWGYGAELDGPDGYRIYVWDAASMRKNA